MRVERELRKQEVEQENRTKKPFEKNHQSDDCQAKAVPFGELAGCVSLIFTTRLAALKKHLSCGFLNGSL